jgi:hypothetical protein
LFYSLSLSLLILIVPRFALLSPSYFSRMIYPVRLATVHVLLPLY